MPTSILSTTWFARLTKRERFLALLVGICAFVIVNLVGVKLLLDGYAAFKEENANDRQTVLRLRALANQADVWNQRGGWLKATQPILSNRDRAGTALYEQIQGLARAQQVVLSSLQIKPALTTPGANPTPDAAAPQPVSVEGETQGDWSQTVRFLAEVQKPENFLVFELASLRATPADVKQLHCHFVIAKWYAAAAK